MKVNENGTLLKVKCLILLSILVSSPRMWGCSFRCLCQRCTTSVFPTHVGMFPSSCHGRSNQHSLPHACGDVPQLMVAMLKTTQSSPRMWGCPCSSSRACESGSLPHACGGFPKKQNFSFLLASRKCLLYKCFQRTDTCRFSFKSFVCSVPSEFQFTGQGMGAMVARHISALFVNLTFHLRRNHHVRRICSRS